LLRKRFPETRFFPSKSAASDLLLGHTSRGCSQTGCRKAAGSSDIEGVLVVDERQERSDEPFSAADFSFIKTFKRPLEQERSKRDGEAYCTLYVEALSDARTMLEGRFNIR
jgi:hypothetical protein